MCMTRKSYPSDVSDAEWEFLAPFLALMREDAPQREYPLRTLFNALRYVVKTGCPGRFLPNDLPPWATVYQQARRWFDSGVFEQVSHELRVIVRIMERRESQPSAAILDARTIQSTPESGGHAKYDGASLLNDDVRGHENQSGATLRSQAASRGVFAPRPTESSRPGRPTAL
jgi:transposase